MKFRYISVTNYIVKEGRIRVFGLSFHGVFQLSLIEMEIFGQVFRTYRIIKKDNGFLH